MSESRIEQFEAFLSRKRKRMTRDRRIIAQTAFTLAGPFNAETVLHAVNEVRPRHRLSRSAVYRTLAYLETAGLVRLN